MFLFLLVGLCLSSANSFLSLRSPSSQFSLNKLDAVIGTHCAEVVSDLDEVKNSWILKEYGNGPNAIHAIECIDRKLDDDFFSIQVAHTGGLGLVLVELASIPNSKYGLVAVREIVPGSNAKKCGKFYVGDVLVSILQSPNDYLSSLVSSKPSLENSTQNLKKTSLEALNLNATLHEISKFDDVNEVIIKVRRLTKRENIEIQLYDFHRHYTGVRLNVYSGHDMPLRTILLNNNIELYDQSGYTRRVDSPYLTGDCGGDCICGTCLVQVLSGKEILNSRTMEEDLILKKMMYPHSFRLACRVQLGVYSNIGGTIKVMLMPQFKNIS